MVGHVSEVVYGPIIESKGDASALVSPTSSTVSLGHAFLFRTSSSHPVNFRGWCSWRWRTTGSFGKRVPRARRLPSSQKREADDVTNTELRHFDPKKRIEADSAKVGRDLMHDLFKVGDDHLAELD